MIIMYNLNKLERKEIKRLYVILKDQFGFDEKLDYYFLINNKNKIFIINKEITKIDLNNLRINSIGLYFGELRDDDLRLSIEGSQIIGPKAGKNVLELDDIEVRQWLKGEDIQRKGDEKYIIIKHGPDFIGCGRQTKEKILNFMPKVRRLAAIN